MSPLVRFICVISIALLPTSGFAVPEEAPPHSVSPTLNGLNVTYFVKKDPFKIVLYAVNHEKFPIICDADYSSGSDKQNAHEQTFDPEKGVAFKFSFGRRSNSVLLRLVCAKPGSPEASPKND